MNFTKMQGLGNDYLYVYGEVPENIEELSIRLSDRHFGAGSDGMIYISQSDRADFSMRIFNADGSEARMCGNGIRCVGKYVYDKGYTDKTSLRIETLSGIKTLELHLKDNKVDAVTVDMGKVLPGDEVGITALNRKWTLLPVSVGNPHAVCFVDDIDGVPLSEVGPVIEKHELFPGGVNSEFVQVLDKDRLRMRVWERGSGITLACGTGACASTMAAVHKGYCQKGKPISVELDGGELEVTILEDGTAMMTGPAMTVYEGSTI